MAQDRLQGQKKVSVIRTWVVSSRPEALPPVIVPPSLMMSTFGSEVSLPNHFNSSNFGNLGWLDRWVILVSLWSVLEVESANISLLLISSGLGNGTIEADAGRDTQSKASSTRKERWSSIISQSCNEVEYYCGTATAEKGIKMDGKYHCMDEAVALLEETRWCRHSDPEPQRYLVCDCRDVS